MSFNLGSLKNYTVSSISAISSLAAGGSTTTTATISRLNDHTASVTMSISDSNFTGSGTISSGSSSGTLTVTSSSSATAAGTYTPSVSFTDGAIVKSSAVSVTLISPVLSISLTGDTSGAATTAGGGTSALSVYNTTYDVNYPSSHTVTLTVTPTLSGGATPTWSKTNGSVSTYSTITQNSSTGVITCVWAGATPAGQQSTTTINAVLNGRTYSLPVTFYLTN